MPEAENIGGGTTVEYHNKQDWAGGSNQRRTSPGDVALGHTLR